MAQPFRIGIVGAGFSGLVAAKVMREYGFEVTVFDTCPDVGGVWSRTRRYPGLTTQSPGDTYALSDHPMPRDYPQWLNGEHVQQYLQSYAERFGLEDVLRLSTRVVHAELDDSRPSWTLQLRDETSGEDLPEVTVDHLVVASGIFSIPFIPDFPGAQDFSAAGGRLCSVSQVNDLEQVRDKDVLVVGYGKSACDAAAAVSTAAASTSVIARELLWKMPRKIANVFNFKYLLLTRLGEGLFRYITPVGFERFIHGPGRPLRTAMFAALQRIVTRQLGLERLGLVPEGSIERIARSTIGLVTESFYEGVADGRIRVHRDARIARLFVGGGRPSAELSDGTVLPADVVICGTGWHQDLPFLAPEVLDRITDGAGNFELYRHILPHSVPALSFCGFNSSIYSPLSAEVAAWWTAAYLCGQVALPPEAKRRAHVTERLAWMAQRTEGRHARGTFVAPFSMHNIDELLTDLNEGAGRLERFTEWFRPIDLAAYAAIGKRLRARIRPSASSNYAEISPMRATHR